MKLAILDFSQPTSTANNPHSFSEQLSLDFSSYPLFQLGKALQKSGQDVVWFHNILQSTVEQGVMCLPLQGASSELLSSMDVVIVFNFPEKGVELAKELNLSTRLILLTDCEREVLATEKVSQLYALESFDATFFRGEWQASDLKWFQGSLEIENISQKAYRYFRKNEYDRAIKSYEEAISKKPNYLSNYWYYGLCLLLKGQETEAQSVWLLPFLELEVEHSEQATQELVAILHEEAKQQYAKGKEDVAWAIRQHIREFNPNHSENIISLVRISLQLKLLSEYEFLLNDFASIFNSKNITESQFEDVVTLFFDVLSVKPKEEIADLLITTCKQFLKDSNTFLNFFWDAKSDFLNNDNNSSFARLKIAEFCAKLEPNNFALWVKASVAGVEASRFEEAIHALQQMLKISTSLTQKIIAYFQTLRGLLNSGVYHQRALRLHPKLLDMLVKLIEDDPSLEILKPEDIFGSFQMVTATCFFPYLQDDPREMHKWRGFTGRFWQKWWQKYEENYLYQYKQLLNRIADRRKSNEYKLKVGYISSSLRKHSVGYLSRWLFQEYNREAFDFYVYSLDNTKDRIALFFEHNSYFRDFTNETKLLHIAKTIAEDEIDILIDLDGFTDQKVSRIMLMKPAPIQATWLGFDASGIPAIDYFIADPYVLPEQAPQYYNETIWRLPQTYIAVNGFDIGVPNVSREELEIPKEAIIYFSSQTAQKRNPDNIRLQMQILKQVPDSYFVTKTVGADQDAIQGFFKEIATEEGIDSDRLRFLPKTPSPETHRANIAIADVVLDTYPYNGATTTMETLWMEVPMVTRVGEQFAARNSYAMMVNAGIEEGIAWTDEEYVEWGIRLGKEPQLRKEISWKLKQSKKSAPLWNAKQFTRDMEAAYQQMWQKYIDESSE